LPLPFFYFLKLVTVSTAATTAAASAESAATATTTAAATAAKSAATTSSAAESTTRACFLGTGFVYVESARADLGSVHSADRFISFLVIGHFHKSKTSRLACITVLQNRHVLYLAISRKCLAEFVFGNFEVQVSYVDILHEVLLRSKQAR
jgi:hypothetical protein